MITKKQYEDAQAAALDYFARAGIAVTEEEKNRIEVADFGLGCLSETGLELLTYVNTERVCAKELVLMPLQTCPEHRHPPMGSMPGKEETFRCRFGTVYLYVSGDSSGNPAMQPPKGVYTVFHEVILHPGEQYTIMPDTLHWFRSGPEGAVVSEFSTRSNDAGDIFTDPGIARETVVK